MTTLTWTDQPLQVEGLVIVATFTIKVDGWGEFVAEVRKITDMDVRYLTLGNLFGSRTVVCGDASVVLDVLDRVSRGVDALPVGASVVE